ncbi:putative protease [Arthrobacter sp. PAMC 25486]|uniref:S1C family serine protease n=1 Tax=Arthrobacter sp. PAMC 25486 TaxID=1494608 RepID=UPI000535D4A5|nr:trypsin-like peptidase domain-containing protein [Arthrobacter sp. PAMC 25486]AIY01336.1 putative protease [Arthrobacter sp. PAMC 25486]
MNENNGDRPINDGGKPEVTSHEAGADAETQDAQTTALPQAPEDAGQPAAESAPRPAVPPEHPAVPSSADHQSAPIAPATASTPATSPYPAAPVQAPQSARAEAFASPAADTQPAGGPAHAAPAPTMNPTEPIPAPYANATNPTEPIPGHYGQQQQAPSPYQAPPTGTGHAGPGYPASNAYPHTLAPAVTARPRERKKVGMGMFTGGVLAAALIGGLVGGGSLYLLDQQGNNTVAGSNQQAAPLVINNPNSVNEVSAAAAKAMPSVVTISATSGTSGGTGSGIILDTEGHILTNTHVVTLDGAAAHATIEVQTSDGKVYPATIVGTDPLSDLAIVKIDAPNLVPAELGESSKINVGDTVIAIGSPLGLNGTVTDGIVSTLNRTIQVASSAVPETPSDSSQNPNDGGNGFQFSPPGGGQSNTAATGTVNLNVIQTDAAINPGNSGGALVNTEGKIIGVNVAIASAGGSDSSSQSGNIGVGFSIPIDHAKRVAQDIIATGKASHGQLGVSVKGTSATGSDSAFSAGATVADVTADSAAAKAGLKAGDVITKLGDRTISDPSDLTAAVREQAGGATVKLDFTRGGKAQSVDVTLDTMPAS